MSDSISNKKLTAKQLQIIDFLYQFRFLSTAQISKILNYPNPKYSQKLLKDLLDNGFINRIYSRSNYQESSTPAVYFLTLKARDMLKRQAEYDLRELDKIYNIKILSQKFIDHCLFIASLYIAIKIKLKINEKLFFLTKAQMRKYDYFPNTLPDAYFVIKGKTKTKRYFVIVFDSFTPPRIIRARINELIFYKADELWEEETGVIFPNLIIICPSERMQKHIAHFTKAKLENMLDNDLAILLTTRERVLKNDILTL